MGSCSETMALGDDTAITEYTYTKVTIVSPGNITL